MLEQVRILKR